MVQNLLFFSKYVSVTPFFSCSQLRESSQQQQLWYHFVFKVNFEEIYLQQKIFECCLIRSIHPEEFLMKYQTSIGKFSFKIAVLNTLGKFVEKYQ